MVHNKSGFTLLEVVISLAVLSILVATFMPILGWLMTRSKATMYDTQAGLILQEGMEVSYNVMVGSWDEDWSVYPEGKYHPAIDVSASPEKWVLLSGAQTGVQAKFDRQIEIKPVCRNNGDGKLIPGNCPPTAGTRDNNSKLLTTTVNWLENGRPKSISAELLVVNLGE